jgi:TPR repeat protein
MMTKLNRVLTLVVLLAWLPTSRVSAIQTQPNDADQKLFAEIRASAEGGNAQSQFELGAQLLWARGQIEGTKWFEKAAEQNHPDGQFALGTCYVLGKGVPKDMVQAVKWYRKAAEQNLAPAQVCLGTAYEGGDGVLQDRVEAVKWFRKAAEQKWGSAQYRLGRCYYHGNGVAQDRVEAVKWFRKAAEQGCVDAQCDLGFAYYTGDGVLKDPVQAVRWFRKATEQDYAHAELFLGLCYLQGDGVATDPTEAVRWLRKAAEQNLRDAQAILGNCYDEGNGVPNDKVESYKWTLLAGSQGHRLVKESIRRLEAKMTRQQLADGQKLAREFKPRIAQFATGGGDSASLAQTPSIVSGTGFFITDDGYFVTNAHVVNGGGQIRLVTSNGMISAKLVKVDTANDLALLKAEGKFDSLPVSSSRTVKLGATVSTVGFPNIGLQGFAPKLSKGEIASLSGAEDDPRYFQISVPLQPGNSGGALVDEHGNVIGVVSAKLNAQTALAATGALPENVNYAVKSSFLLSFLESTPDVSSKLKEVDNGVRAFEAIVQSTQQATVLVLVY